MVPDSELWCEREPWPAYDFAKEQYLKGEAIEQIRQKTGHTKSQLHEWVYGNPRGTGWRSERGKIERRVREKVFDEEKERFGKVLEDVVTALENGAKKIRELTDQGVPVPIDDLKKLLQMTVKLKEMSEAELPENKIDFSVKLTVEGVMKDLLEADPIGFGAIDITPDSGFEEIEYEEEQDEQNEDDGYSGAEFATLVRPGDSERSAEVERSDPVFVGGQDTETRSSPKAPWESSGSGSGDRDSDGWRETSGVDSGEGDVILFKNESAKIAEIDGIDVLVMTEASILGIVTEPTPKKEGLQ